MEPEPVDARPERWPARRRFAAFSLAVAGVAACEGAPSGGLDGAGTPIALEASDVRVLGTSDAIADVQDLEVLPDGTVWVLNSLEPYFIAIGPDGEVLHAHGTAGDGPREFRMPAGFVAGGIDGETWVFDYVRHALIEISRPDAPWSEISLASDSLPPGSVRGGMNLMVPGVRTARLGDEVIVPRSTGTMESGIVSFWRSLWGADLLALDPETGSVRKVVGLGDVLGDPMAALELTEGGFPQWYRLWGACGQAGIRVHDRLRNQIRTFDVQGREQVAVDLPPVRRTEVTPRQFAQAIFPLRLAEVAGGVGGEVSAADSLRLMNDMIQAVRGEPEQLATYLPRYVDFRCAADGTVWIQPFDVGEGLLEGGRVWLRISPDGATREIHVPDRFDPYRFTSERIWGVLRDELDVASVAWIAVPEA